MIWVRREVWCGIALMTLLDQSSWRSSGPIRALHISS